MISRQELQSEKGLRVIEQSILDDQDIPIGQYGQYGDMLDSTGTEAQTYNQLATKHDQYADEIEKIKAMLGE